ncbi:MAG: alkaline phosphatase family protein [Thermomicrobiales bacterium]
MYALRWLQRMARSHRRMASLVMLFALITGSATGGAALLIGKQTEGWFLIPTNQTVRSTGQVTLLDQRPVDMALRPDGSQLAVMTTNLTYLLNPTTGEITQQFDKQDRNVAGLAYSPDGTHLYYAKGKDHKIGVAAIDPAGKATFEGDIDTGAKTWPAGLSVSPDGATLYVALFGTNSMGIIHLADRSVKKTVPVGSSPFGAYISPDGTAVYTSNWGGPLPQPGDAVDPLFPVRVDPTTGASAAGSLSVYDVAADTMRPEIAVGLHPTAMVFSKESTRLYVANSNEDTISVLDLTAARGTNPEIERISVRPDGLPFGSMPNGLALSPDLTTLYVANCGNNAIAVIRLDSRVRPPGTYTGPNADAPATSGVIGFIPTEWYPIAVTVSADGTKLAVANNKGEGSLGTPQRAIPNGGKSVFSLTGSVTFVDVPNADQLAAETAQFNENNPYGAALAGSLQPPRPDATPTPVPARIGEPSVFKHVLYVIKENRTYDQVLGDLGKGNSEPKLAQFPRRVSPNHHALADRFGLLDNYYASSVNSADGHQWTDEAVANVFAERVYGFYPSNNPMGITSYGNSSLDLPPDSLWSNALNHGVSLRNYGEDGINTVTQNGQEVPAPSLNWSALYKDWRDKTGLFTYTASAITPPLLSTEDHAYPAFETAIPDQIRADEWQREFDGYVAMGDLPQLSVIWLPDDHTSGLKSSAPTPEAQVADNDLALGRIVDTLSHSPYWKDTAVFVTEDDAQNGVDHVDGHRTVGMVISAYGKQGIVDSTLYNQTSMVRTIEQILGLPPMNQFDLTAPLMTTMFADTPDLTPYTVIPNQIPLDMLNGQASALTGQAREDARVSDTLDFSVPDATDPTILNPIIWRATMGNRPYPHFAWEKSKPTGRDDDG